MRRYPIIGTDGMAVGKSQRITRHGGCRTPLEPGVRYSLDLHLEAAETVTSEEPDFTWVEYEVRSGDSMAIIFQRLGFSARQLHDLTQASDANVLRRIHPGVVLRFAKNDDNELEALHYRLSQVETLVFERNEDGGYSSRREAKATDIRLAFAHAEITSNFWNAGVQAGLTQGQIMSLAELFGWDVDFALDIRRGDQFSVLFLSNVLLTGIMSAQAKSLRLNS